MILYNFFKVLYNSDKKNLTGIILCNIIIGLFPGLLLYSLNKIVYFKNNEKIGFCYILFGLMVLHFILKIILTDYVTSLSKKFQYSASRYINLLIFNKIDKLDYRKFENSYIYDLLQQVRQDSLHRPQTIIMQSTELIVNLFALISFLLVLFSWNIYLSCLILIFTFIPMIFLKKFQELEYRKELKRLESQRKHYYISFILSSFQYIKELRVFLISKYFLKRYDKIFEKFRRQDKIFFFKKSVHSSIILLSSMIPLLIFNIYLIKLLIKGSLESSFFLILMQTSILFHSAIQNLVLCKIRLYESKLYVSKLFEFLAINEMTNIEENNLNLSEIKKEINVIEFKNISFKYDSSSSYILNEINLEIKTGEKIAIVGSNGSGKSTIVKLLLRLYEPSSGEILFNNINIKNISLNSWYQYLSVLFQDFNKYEMPLFQNIILDEELILEKFNSVVEKSDLTYFVNSLPNGCNTKLGVLFHNGIELSGGQWQKIALARAYYKKSGLMILDEPTSAIDPSSESEVIENFYNDLNQMGILITHRMNHVLRANKIYVLDAGRIVEEGNHKQLVSLNGVYSNFYILQNPDIQIR